MTALSSEVRDDLVAAARLASSAAYAPYSRFHVGAALLFDDGEVISGANVENASYGLSLCAETAAIAAALNAGRRGGLVAVAVFGGPAGADGAAVAGTDPITPCGRCRQVLNELAQLGGTDPEILCAGEGHVMVTTLAALLPHAFGPASLG
ncbi:cytidine deaminase [Novosphingobium tardum]|jgi:cytidine deaminase|uniref:Cytidine deaminase n=1 Tax=Novosphingobium tardum TaxID=1538021 RepID=A0ABV8RK13_9SPHN